MMDLTDWMNEHTGPPFIWYVKRLSGNDTLANGSHQAGPYIPKSFLFRVFPSLCQPETLNPEKWFAVYIDSHPDVRRVRAIWYNNRVLGTGTRNEARVTNFGGAHSALLDPESTGALTVFVFQIEENGEASTCHVWVCRHETEADLVEERVGPVEPGTYKIWMVNEYGLFPPNQRQRLRCWLEANEIPVEWRDQFPSGAEIVRKTVEYRPAHGVKVDKRLLQRRDCEFELFRSVEEAVEFPWIQRGFGTVDEFIVRAQTILQRRKSRSGRSLELHTREILLEEGLKEGVEFAHQPESDRDKHPDFLFPSQTAYHDPNFPAQRLRMLAVKTTCKDRWRQILNEADRIPHKHLLTLQQGVSENQFKEMTDAQVQLVVPAPLFDCYPSSVQPYLQTLESFIADVRFLLLT